MDLWHGKVQLGAIKGRIVLLQFLSDLGVSDDRDDGREYLRGLAVVFRNESRWLALVLL